MREPPQELHHIPDQELIKLISQLIEMTPEELSTDLIIKATMKSSKKE